MRFSSLLLIFLLTHSVLAQNFELSSKSHTFSQDTKLRLVVEHGVNVESSEPGDSFIARLEEHVKSNTGEIIIPQYSWVTGHVEEVEKPKRLSRAGKLSLSLDNLITINGQMIPIDAKLSFEEGKINVSGELDPQEGFSDTALNPTKKLLNNKTGKILSIATLGLPVAGTLIGGSTLAMLKKGESIGLETGEKFEIYLTSHNFTVK